MHKGHEDWAYLLSRVGLEKLSQADTERVVKLQRKIEPRFSSFDETKLEAGKRDRCMQEMFLCDNKIAMDKLPLNDYARAWKKIVVKKDARARDDSVALTGFLKKETSALLFMQRSQSKGERH